MYLITPRLIFLKHYVTRCRFKCYVTLFVSIDLILCLHISVVKVSGLWTEDHDFESAWSFYSCLLNKIFDIIIFHPNLHTFRLSDLYTSYQLCYLSYSRSFLLILKTKGVVSHLNSMFVAWHRKCYYAIKTKPINKFILRLTRKYNYLDA